MNRALAIPAADGTIDAHLFTPAGASGPLCPVLMFTDVGGLRPAYFAKAQHVADRGYAVLLPNIYYRSAAGQVVPEGKSFRDPDVRPTIMGYAAQLTAAAQQADFAALLAAVDREPEFAGGGGVGAVGYCLTGGFALRIAALHPDRIVAAAGFHSARLAVEEDEQSPMHAVGTIQGRVYLGHADKDELLPPAQIARLDGALAEAGVHFTTELYRGALHGFSTPDGPAYHEAAAALHYKRLFTLLEETLGG